MADNRVIARIKQICEEKGWSYYRLHKTTGIPYTTLTNMLNRNTTPTVPTLERICEGFGITMSQFFAYQQPESKPLDLTDEQRKVLISFDKLSDDRKKLFLAYLQGLLDQ